MMMTDEERLTGKVILDAVRALRAKCDYCASCGAYFAPGTHAVDAETGAHRMVLPRMGAEDDA